MILLSLLKTQASLDANASWTIEISNKKATITAQGSNKRNTIKWNNDASTGMVFSCYESTKQQPVSIYKATSTSSDEVKSDLEIAPAVYTTTVNSNQSNTGANAVLWISIVSVGAVLISLGAVVVIFALRKKSE